MINFISADIKENRTFNLLNHSLVNDTEIQQWYRNIKVHIYFYRLHFTNYTLTVFGSKSQYKFIMPIPFSMKSSYIIHTHTFPIPWHLEWTNSLFLLFQLMKNESI